MSKWEDEKTEKSDRPIRTVPLVFAVRRTKSLNPIFYGCVCVSSVHPFVYVHEHVVDF